MVSLAMEEYELMKDSKYRVYVSAVDKALKNFEYTSEWADLISALGKLNKVLMNNMKFPVIPRRIKISKRLAQCMHPALPSGVHLKALETYDVIFKCMGTNRLAHELFIYSAGLFPLLGHAAMNVRILLLTVYETHFVPLGERLRPALSGFLSGVLPGLESGSDHYESTNSLLEKVCEGVGASYFYSCLWECLACNGPTRLPAVSFVLGHFNKRLSMAEQPFIMGKDTDVLVIGLCACMRDHSVLVQRSALELLLVGFPLHSSQLQRDVMVKLVVASLTTILRRDMSLNRRLYSWLLGSEVNKSQFDENHPLVKKTQSMVVSGDTSCPYFELYSRKLLIEAIRITLTETAKEDTPDLKPYRLLMSLLDKTEIGPVILDDILYDVIRTLYVTCGERKNNKICEEVLKSANMLFSSLEPYYIWEYLGNCFGNMCRELHTSKSSRITENITCKSSSTIASDTEYKPPNLLEICTLAEFLLDILPLETYIDTTSEHLPKLFYKITNLLSEYCHVLMVEEIVNSLYLCMKIVSRVQTVVTHSPKTESDNISSRLSVSMLEITKSDTNLKVQKRKDVNGGLSIEKSKSDSKLHETTNEILIKDTSKKRSKSLKHKKNKKHRSTESLNSILSMDLEINILQNDMDTDKNTKDNSKYIGVVINETQPDKESDPIRTEKQSLIEKCLRCYELFFVNFISQRLLNLSTSKNNIDELFNKLLLTDNNYYKTSNDTDNLEKLLNNTLRLSKSEHDELVKPYEISINDHQILTNSLITDRSNCQSLYHAVKLSCRILVELSTFPTYVPQDTSINMVKYHDGMQIPDWLKVLVLCSSFLRNDPDLQLTAISTLLDLVSLLRTQCGSDESDVGVFGVRKSSSSGVTSVVMIPLLRQWHVEYMEKATRIFQILAYSLWEHLGNPMLHNQLLTCASLLHQLHNCLPASCLVEVVLGESMTSEASGRCVESFHRFSTLWHLGRGMEGKACNNAMRTFDKTLLKMLDNLQLPESSPLKLYSASWLIQSLLRGDIHRLLDPVLFILLDPLTARMSVLHVSIHHSSKRLMQRTQSECDSTKKPDSDTSQSSKIYAISSVDGNVIYHVSDSTQSSAAKPSSKIFSRKILNPLKSRKLYSLAANKDKNERSVTGRHYTAKDVIAHAGNLATSPQNISLFVNPFSTTDTSDDSTMDTSTESNQLYPTGRFVKIDSEGGPVHVNYIKGDSGRSDSSSSSLKHSQSIDISNTNPKKSTPNRNSSSGNSTCSNSFGSSNEYYNNNEEPINTSSEYSDQEPFRSGSACDTLISTNCDKTSTSTTPVENPTKLKVVIDLTSKTVEMLEKFENSMHEITDGSFYLPEEAQADEVDNKLDTDEQDEQNHADEEVNELELSTAAEDFFSICVGSSSAEEVLSDIIDKVCHMEVEQLAKSVVNESRNKKMYNTDISKGVHPLHTHILLYCEVYDSNRTLYALQTLRNEIATNTRMFICSAATTGIANVPKGTQLLNLLARHKKSMYGHSFYGDVTNTEYLHSYRSCMYLEVLITICLHFARSYFPNLGNVKLTLEEISGNRKVQLASTEILMLICTELISIVRDSGKGFACYIGDLLSKCKVQKLILQCVMSSVYVMSTAQNKECIKGNLTFTEEIVKFNDPLDNDLSSRKCKFKVSDHTEGFQIQLLRLLLSLIMLDYQVHLHSVDEAPSTPTSVKESPTNTFNLNSLKYNPNLLIPQQPLFLSAILLALQLEHMRHLHQHWTTLLTSALPYMGSNLTHVVISVIHQLCTNIETISKLYHTKSSDSDNCCLPPDYTVTQLEALTVVCHYCLLDSNQQMSHVFNQSYSHGINTGTSNTNPGQIFNNLIHVFMPTPLSQDSCVAKGTQQEAHLQARRVVLSHMPRIVASMAVLWENVTSLKDWEHHSCVLGNPGVVKHQLLEFLSPISLHHGINFLAAIAVAWLERKDNTSRKKILPVANTNQQVLVYLVSEIRVMPMESLVQTVHQVVKSPPPIHGAKPDLSLDVGVLELFYWYMQTASTAQLSDIWPSLLGLLRDGLTLSPSAQFLIIAILNEYVQKCPPFVEKRDQRDLHDITSKLVESISQIAGCCLEQTTWLRRNLAVKEELQTEAETISETNNGNPVVTCGSKLSQLQSVQAQSVLADLLATLLDVAYGSQEKEKVVTILTTLMYNITPYLKNHSQYNVPAFRACSHLLASLSGYPYTRKAWRKDVFDLLLDASLFQMEPKCLVYWRTIIDNLMTHDNTTFRDFMARVSMTQSGSLSIFSSREAEYEQRAQLLRRLAFVIFCSETDQYHKYMPEIQEQLASSLRLLHVVPSVQANVFLCFRVLLLRMSSQHVTSLWPIIISEMVQVFLHIEQELATDTEEFSLHIRLLSALDASWVTNSNNGLHAQGHPHWLQLQLATAKLLDLALVLPAVNLPQFQMYRWAFVSDSEGSGSESYYSSDEDVRLSGHGGVLATAGPLSAVPTGFVPHVTRIARLMDARFDNSQVETIPCKPGELMLTNNRLSSLQELHSFFKTLSMRWHAHRIPDNLGTPTGTGNHSPLALLEAVLENDFLEKLPER